MNIPLRPNAPGGLRFKNLDPQTTRQLLQVAYARMWRHNMVSRGVNRSAAWRKGMSLLEDLDTGRRSIVEFSSTAAEKRKRNGICAYCAADATTTALARRPDVRAWDANGRRVQSRPKPRASSASRASRAQTKRASPGGVGAGRVTPEQKAHRDGTRAQAEQLRLPVAAQGVVRPCVSHQGDAYGRDQLPYMTVDSLHDGEILPRDRGLDQSSSVERLCPLRSLTPLVFRCTLPTTTATTGRRRGPRTGPAFSVDCRLRCLVFRSGLRTTRAAPPEREAIQAAGCAPPPQGAGPDPADRRPAVRSAP